jgi:hypothetical protein
MTDAKLKRLQQLHLLKDHLEHRLKWVEAKLKKMEPRAPR